MNTEFPDKSNYLSKKLAYPWEDFHSIDESQNSKKQPKKEDFFSKSENAYPSDENIERTKEFIGLFVIKKEELTKLYLEIDVILLTCVFEKFVKVSIIEFDINPLYAVSLRHYSWQRELNYTDIRLQTLQGKDMILSLENNLCAGIGSVMGDRYVKTDETKSILFVDAKNLFAQSMC